MYTNVRNALGAKIMAIKEKGFNTHKKSRAPRIKFSSIHVDNSGKTVEELNALYAHLELSSGVIFETHFTGVYSTNRTYDETCIHLHHPKQWINMIRDDGFSIGNFRSLCNRCMPADIVITRSSGRNGRSLAESKMRLLFAMKMANTALMHEIDSPVEPLIALVEPFGRVVIVDNYIVVSEYKGPSSTEMEKLLIKV
jgi:hypothetical protein